MRVVKTNSTRNSPQNAMLSRRKTVMNDSPYRRRPVGEQTNMVPGFFDAVHPQARFSRPQSWHSTSYLVPQASSYPSESTTARFDLSGTFNPYEIPPTPAAFSGYTSPSSTFSPISQPLAAYEQEQYPFADNMSLIPTSLDTTNVYVPFQPSTLRYQTESHNISSGIDTSMFSQFDWNNFAVNGFDHGTAPPTPDNLLPIQHQDPSFEAEESIPYQSLEELDDDGEELVGMGLYDTPEKPAPSDLRLDNYRALMMTQLLGSTYRKPEPAGKGLKLEETWNPPPSDDENDDGEGDQDEDAEGSVADDASEDLEHRSALGAAQPSSWL